MKLNEGLKAYGMKAVLALMTCILITSTASAQRTMNGQDNISASIHYSFSGQVPIGADLWWGRYLLSGNAKAASATLHSLTHSLLRLLPDHGQFKIIRFWHMESTCTGSSPTEVAISVFMLAAESFSGANYTTLRNGSPSTLSPDLATSAFYTGYILPLNWNCSSADRHAY